jgi:hypothetical protein
MTFSGEASQHLERYLEEMRASMSQSEHDGVAEIEQDIRDHIEAELGERPSPISADELDAVLARLGSPAQWGAGSAAAVAVPHPISNEDWLAYASSALLLVGFAVPILWPVSFLLARWVLARIEQRGEPVGARRWLLYPPLAVVSIAIALFILFWPFGAFAELGMMVARNAGLPTHERLPHFVTLAVTFGCLGAYWIIVGVIAGSGERLVRSVFHPFAGRFRRRHGWMLSGAGAILAAAGGLTAYLGTL